MSGPRVVGARTRTDPGTWLPTLATYLGDQLGQDVHLADAQSPSGSGMSGVSLLFTATWGDQQRRLVARVMPHPDELPVFPDYDVDREAEVMTTVGRATDLPVPEVLWTEPSGSVLGQPFMIIEALPGQAPPDNPPYVFGGWLAAASPDQQCTLESSTIDVLAAVHRVPAPAVLRPADGDPRSPLRAHLDDSRSYYEWTTRTDGVRIPVLEAAFDWLEANLPTAETDPVLCWGDSRIGNVLYTDFRPTGVLDWEFARYGPPEVDLGWLICFHAMFQDLAAAHGAAGMPDFMRREPMTAAYESASGTSVRDLDFYLTYAAVRHGIVMGRIARRSIMLGDREPSTDPDDLVLHRRMLQALIDGTYIWA